MSDIRLIIVCFFMASFGYGFRAFRALVENLNREKELETHIGEQYLGAGEWSPLFDDEDLEEFLSDD
ncbi:hypothetical protein UFOVP227_32 [uncultured Caudovirales phage]|uniref:Uncharacterized protein n=1 Tax=uncultured Caudovirales phage TaxID=2100421 RepID=A0A6J7WM01_9CAUD|nr:hypothetical protein UFOVP227_32 [uncultured Caudovirales phage]